MRSKKIRGFSCLISENGEITSLPRIVKCGYGKTRRFAGGIRISHINKNGYLMITIKESKKEKRCYVHRLVAEAFLKRVKGKEHINHKDGDKLNNRLSNLEWCTKSENAIHAIKNGLKKYNPASGESYIHYDKFSKSYRVLLPKKDMGRYKTFEEAKIIKDKHLK